MENITDDHLGGFFGHTQEPDEVAELYSISHGILFIFRSYPNKMIG